jgi:methylmalonyl-CoA mutase
LDTPVIPIAAGFARATRDEWLSLAAKTLKGAAVGTLAGATPDGVAIQPLYSADGAAAPLPFEGGARGGERPWDVRAIVRHGEAAGANAQILEALAGGAASVLARIDPRGQTGIAVSSADDMARLLDGVMIDVAPVALDAGFHGARCAQWLANAAKASPAAPLAFHLEPLSAFAAAGASPGPIEAHVAACAKLGAGLAEPYPKAAVFLASGCAVHEAGGAPTWELAFAVAAALAYAKALVAAGLAMRDAFERIVVGLAIDQDPLASIAKLRAARILWGAMTGACGVDLPARIEARSSQRMLTRADRWSNLVRLTAAGFAGAVGGADAIVLGAFTDAIGPPDLFALRMARNTQLILMQEAHLGAVADPAAGAWAFEALTADLARAAWAGLQTIEAAGGLVQALVDGLIAREVAASREALRADLVGSRMKIIGVTDFRDGEEGAGDQQPPPAPSAPPREAALSGPDSRCPPLTPVRLEDLAR